MSEAVERTARASYGRLLAFLAARTNDLAAAEDALQDALCTALERWPRDGVPRNPDAWLLTAARRKLIDAQRHARVELEAAPRLAELAHGAQQQAGTESGLPDERLELLFLCAHPAIDSSTRTPLMLQTILGLDAARIARAFAVQPAAMGQRLARAKRKIRDARISFALPEAERLPERLDAVLEAIYAAYGSAWDDVAGADDHRGGLGSEAIDLARVLTTLLPDEPEARGLLALMLHCEARRAARRGPHGEYVPLSDQDPRRWCGELIEQAERQLAAAAPSRRPGRFQWEAAIQSAHAQRRQTGQTDWQAIALLYEGLVRCAPTLGALVGRAAAVAQACGAEAGMRLLRQMPAAAVDTYQPYWALVAHLTNDQQAYARAIKLAVDPAVREFLASTSAYTRP